MIPVRQPLPPRPVDARPMSAADPLDAWLRRHQRGPWRFLRMCGCPADVADDLTQEVLLAALHKRIDTLPDDAAERWLRGAARNLWRMHLRAQRRRAPVEDLERADLALAQHGAADGGDAYVAALRQCVALLDGRARAALELRYRDEASREAMATALELSPDGVKSLLRRTRDLLTACVRRRVHGEGERP